MDAPASHSPSGRTNKRKRGAPDLYEKLVGMPGSTKQVTKTISMGAACSLTSDLTKILQKKPALASSAIDLLDLYLCLPPAKYAWKRNVASYKALTNGWWERMRSSKNAVITRSCCCGIVVRPLTLYIRTLSQSGENRRIYRYHHLVSQPIVALSVQSNLLAERPRAIECIFYPNHDSECAFSWTGPDLLSLDTCADDIFLYVSAFFLFERVHWIEIRLSKLSTGNEEVVEEYPFFLPRVESMLGNLRRVRGQIRDIISRNGYMGSAGETRFQLSLRPQIETVADPGMRSAIPLSCIHPSLPIASFDPQFFV
ncbi:uncharacterized protein N7525_004638 [Penicillium rubens]|uniref:uncharacterized protein n=1 Tax=Penicillium rubens TaxID=1108849 RepID=UPI002A5A0F2C|nr:uncharacterized protein N7525_004638 [Penicillium rubens]KAJ5839450.1 hypothetical protein N7525_004638 [Penicillium rubens]